METIFLFFLSLSILLILYYSKLIFLNLPISSLLTKEIVHKLFLISFIIWGFIPVLLNIISDFKYANYYEVRIDEIIFVYFLELISYILFFTTFLLLIFTKKGVLKKRAFFLGNQEQNFNKFNFFLNTSIFLSYCFIVLFIYKNLANVLYHPLIMHIMQMGLFTNIFLYVYNRKLKSRKKNIFLFIFIVYLMISILKGSHGEIFFPLIVFFIIYSFYFPKNYIWSVILIMAGLFYIFYDVMHLIREGRINSGETFNIFSDLRVLYDNISSTDLLSITRLLEFIDYATYRLGVNGIFSVAYIRLYNEGMAAYYYPVYNTLLSIIDPQVISGSLNGEENTLGMRLIHLILSGSKSNMSMFFSSAHSYWEFGFFGVVIIPIIYAVFLFYFFIIINYFSILSLPLILIFFDTWWPTPMLWSYEMLIKAKVFIPLFLVFLVIYHTFKDLNVTKFNKKVNT